MSAVNDSVSQKAAISSTQRAEIADEEPAERRGEQRAQPKRAMAVEERREPPPRAEARGGGSARGTESRDQQCSWSLAPDLGPCVPPVLLRHAVVESSSSPQSSRSACPSSRRPPTRPRRSAWYVSQWFGSSVRSHALSLTAPRRSPRSTIACASGEIMWFIQRYMQFGFCGVRRDHPRVRPAGRALHRLDDLDRRLSAVRTLTGAATPCRRRCPCS